MPSKLDTTTKQRAAHLRAQGEAIAAARARSGLSQPAAALVLGVSKWTLRSWEQGVRLCPTEVRRRIVKEWKGDRKVLGPDGDRCACCGRPW